MTGNITKLNGTIFASLKSRHGKKAQPQLSTYHLIVCLGMHWNKTVIILWNSFWYTLIFNAIQALSWLITYYQYVLPYCILLQFCNGQIEELDSNVQPFLKAFNKKFDDCENHITLAIQMRNCNNAASVVKAVKPAVENYVLNGTSNETSRVRILRFPSTAKQPIISPKRTFT